MGDSQSFNYDALDRLTSASATGELADYSEPYAYNATTGNLETKGALNLSYPAEPTMNCVNDRANPAHGVESAGGNNYEYDCNGNMVIREIDAGALAGDYELVYDAENRLVEVKKDSQTIAEFVYDADGRRVKSIMDGETRLFVGDHYEVVVNGTETKYYFAGTSMIALRKDGVLNFILGDHLGSTSLTTDADGVVISELLYRAASLWDTAWGEVRHKSGVTATNHTYTGQYSNVSDFGLMYYRARWMDPQLGRFTQPDTIIPEQSQGTQAWDRYGYVNNNPVRYTDPTGRHLEVPNARRCGPDNIFCGGLYGEGSFIDQMHNRTCPSTVCFSPGRTYEITIALDVEEKVREINEALEKAPRKIAEQIPVEVKDLPFDPMENFPKIPIKTLPQFNGGGSGGPAFQPFLVD